MLQSSELAPPRHAPPTLADRTNRSIRIDLAPTNSNPKVSVIVPTLNEAKNLPHVLPLIPESVYEVILVDGNSTDDTIDVARSILPDIRVVMQEGRGKGNALRQGFAAATGDIIVMLDADGSTDPGEIPAFVGALMAGADFAKGSRFVQGGGTADMEFHRKLGNWGFVFLSRLMFGGNYSDLCYGYNAFWRHVLPVLDLNADGFEIETEMNVRALRNGLKVIEVGSFEHPRLFGTSNLHAIRDGWRVLKCMFKEYVQGRRSKKAVPEINRVETDDSVEEPVQLLLGEALHFILNKSQDLSPETCHHVMQAVQKSISTHYNVVPTDLRFVVRLEHDRSAAD